MKKLLVSIAILFISISCGIGDNPGNEVVQKNKEFTPTVIIQQATGQPTISPTADKAKKVGTPTKIPTLTPRPTYTSTPDSYSTIKDEIGALNNPELDYIFQDFSKATVEHLDDYSYNGATEYTLFPSYIDILPEEFVIISNVSWNHSSDKITESAASCGFMFLNNMEDKSYFAVVSADGNVRLINMIEEYWNGVAHKKYKGRTLNPQSDEVQIIMSVQPYRFVLAVEGDIILDKAMEWDSVGYFGYTLISGTNRDYGTRCSFKDTIIFINKETEIQESPNG